MKALQFAKTGDLSALQYIDVPQPVPAENEVLVQVKAAGLNPSDVKNVLGRFPYTTMPRIPGRDFAGVVIEGPQEMLGQEVWGTGKEPGFFRDGSHAEYLTLPAKGVAPKPKALSFVQAASLGVPLTTAWNALERSLVETGTRLLVIGANGAVGSAALALGKVLGAQVLGAVRRPEQICVLKADGFDAILLDKPEDLGAQVNAVFPGGADVIFDTTGFWLPAAVAALATLGRIAIIAAPVDGQVQMPTLALYRKGGSVVGINTLLYGTEACAGMLNQFGRFFDEGLMPLPTGIFESSLSEGLARYEEVNKGGADKVVFVF
ncbi:zinc-binding alcohol dehydrogenase family protein [Pseudomonas sp. CCI3.2]|uniref:quinone oxidoreductase family protein n=1 Tax=unclassified Pseudomonas TaxID=196821 RepID=UPI002AC95504|nr:MULTISPECIES: zinc-binding alcohol dehydrogenase family protein [unclassified Pseudomonas]MEB0077354.1 zinc-binding alcohol dehydrogenase family protein [Pseudomonas sp. MH10out]MEB0092864.1 zinc-binding alcohol dehydrogenase family protein [Pseudomonas sp. CCI4.2]MEB0104300.1 zinc-binding alcohol dehydrogenase family protein [Pseudomonas sp. CCI3.2]MEB0120532.1 zinc-binding alcohol dehydrogenase family protein [Pseudomonas sp. CCI1.2]MEB0129957.1 zinc-binding alcohol dehydrogenase family p